MSKKNVILFKLLDEVLVDNFLALFFEILFSFKFADVLVKTINVVV